MLTIYRRHAPDCQFHGRTRQRSARANSCEKRCPIWVQGSLRGETVRRSLDLRSWEAASDLIHKWNASGQIGVEKITAPPLTEAVSRFIKDAEARGLRPSSIKKYQRLLDELLAYCKFKNVSALERITVDFLRQFRESMTHAPLTQQKKVEYLRAFFGFAADAGWIPKNPAKAVKLARITQKPTLPFSADEISKLLDACATFKGNGARLHALILLLRHSGLRIGDAVALERSRIEDGRIFLYTAKTGTPVRCPLPAAVIKELRALPGEKYFFWSGTSKLQTALGGFYRAFLALAIRAKVQSPHFHRLRNSFAVSLLEKGVPVETVAMLLGNTPAIVLKHYSPWVLTRQASLEAAVLKALA